MIIDANNLVLGRLASFAAKQALLGEKVDIINSGEVIIVGDKRIILEKYRQRRARGNPHHCRYFPIQADRIMKRTIRNMLPHKQYKGKKAFKNIRCYIGMPESMNKESVTSVENAKMKSTTLKHIKLRELVYLLHSKK